VSEPPQPGAPQPDPVARSPIAPAPPVIVLAGWEVSGRRATAGPAGGGLTLTDCTPLAKLQLRAPAGGQVAAALGVPFGRAARDRAGPLVVGSGPGEWLLLAPPGHAPALASMIAGIAAQAHGEAATWVDLTHGRALIRLNGSSPASVLAKLCGIDLSDDVIPDGAAFRTSVASLATDIIRDDLPGSADGAAGTRSYLLHCERSSGQYLFNALLRAGSEFGIETDGFRLPPDSPGPALAAPVPDSPGPAPPAPSGI
jgi:heterotetrameric sarcosine oxidase gamma subunit